MRENDLLTSSRTSKEEQVARAIDDPPTKINGKARPSALLRSLADFEAAFAAAIREMPICRCGRRPEDGYGLRPAGVVCDAIELLADENDSLRSENERIKALTTERIADLVAAHFADDAAELEQLDLSVRAIRVEMDFRQDRGLAT